MTVRPGTGPHPRRAADIMRERSPRNRPILETYDTANPYQETSVAMPRMCADRP